MAWTDSTSSALDLEAWPRMAPSAASTARLANSRPATKRLWRMAWSWPSKRCSEAASAIAGCRMAGSNSTKPASPTMAT